MREDLHDEIVSAFRSLEDPRYGAAVAADRGSKLEYLGLTFPEWRGLTRKGFSFYSLPADEVLDIWDGLWRESPYGEVLFAAIEYYRKTPARQPPGFWDVVRGWIDRIDNWSHADSLAGLYSEVLERHVALVYPQLERWNATDGEWERRISIVSLIHYSGKNAVFMPLEKVLPLVTDLLEDDRYYVQTAVGWVLRETGNVHWPEIRSYLEANGTRMSASAFSRAIERRPPEEKAALRMLRRDAIVSAAQPITR
jgi:3-methyladenine DNA glycosylase AlkD